MSASPACGLALRDEEYLGSIGAHNNNSVRVVDVKQSGETAADLFLDNLGRYRSGAPLLNEITLSDLPDS